MSNVAIIASTAVETFSIAMLEAMSMEVPLVATNIGGTNEAVLNNNTGLIVNPGDVNELYKALFYLSNNVESVKEMGKKARCQVIQYFEKKIMITETEKMLINTKDK